ncbi:PREDICTED: monothiol glutaredoxin-S1-like [Camelina sativa]|uniref:Monothiol glutaredoxin-S1-like n=1 Tax=Camelina sativa TaxID=90675 RepID=A0ABM0X6H2_CAMSA|nr:PREDICTED: monothiol glutaredoxin-S1-like [Camelina sativa]
MEKISNLLEDKPVVIFSKTSCCMSHTIKSLISGYGANPTVYELDAMSNGAEVERALAELGCKPTVPAVFIGQQLVGGANQLMSLQVRNQLGSLLRRAGAIWI